MIIGGPSSARDTRNALIASVTGYSIDGFDLLVLGFLLTGISASFHLDQAKAGSLLTATLIGAVLGGMAFGTLSDRFGRVKVLSWTILLFSIATGACGLARDYNELLVARTVAGLGLGGEFGIGMTLIAEVWPPTSRARGTSYVALGWQGGALAATLLTPLLLPAVGWRGMFGLAMIPGLLFFFVRRAVPEPEVWRHSIATRPAHSIVALVDGVDALRKSVAIVLMCSVQNFGYYALMVWLPAYLTRTMAYSLTRSSLWTASVVGGMCLGILSFGQIADRLGRRPAFALFQAGAAVSVYVYAHLTTPAALLFGGAVMGFFANGTIGGYGALIAELFPTEARSTAENVLFNLGRGAGGFGPLVVGALAATYSMAAAIALLSGIYVLALLVTLTLLPETKAQDLASLSATA